MLRSIYSKIKSNEKAIVNAKYFFWSGLIFHHRESASQVLRKRLKTLVSLGNTPPALPPLSRLLVCVHHLTGTFKESPRTHFFMIHHE